MTLRPVLALCGATVTAISFAAAGPALAKGTKLTTVPAWTPPVYMAGGGAEPSIKNPIVGSHNPAAYVSAPTGPNGTIVWTVDRSLVGSPPDGAVLQPLYGDAGPGAGQWRRSAVDGGRLLTAAGRPPATAVLLRLSLSARWPSRFWYVANIAPRASVAAHGRGRR